MSRELKISFTGQFKNKHLGSKCPTKRFWLEINWLMTTKAAVADDDSYMYVILVDMNPTTREREREGEHWEYPAANIILSHQV